MEVHSTCMIILELRRTLDTYHNTIMFRMTARYIRTSSTLLARFLRHKHTTARAPFTLKTAANTRQCCHRAITAKVSFEIPGSERSDADGSQLLPTDLVPKSMQRRH